MNESGSHIGPGQLPISWRRNGLRIWFKQGEPRGGVAPDLHGIDLVTRVRRIMGIPQPGKTSKPLPKAETAAKPPKPKRKPNAAFMAP